MNFNFNFNFNYNFSFKLNFMFICETQETVLLKMAQRLKTYTHDTIMCDEKGSVMIKYITVGRVCTHARAPVKLGFARRAGGNGGRRRSAD